MLLLNDLLLEWVSVVDCSKLKRVNLNCSFNHFCQVYSGLSAIYAACPQIEYLNISSSLNARVQECEEKWPATLKEVKARIEFPAQNFETALNFSGVHQSRLGVDELFSMEPRQMLSRPSSVFDVRQSMRDGQRSKIRFLSID